MADPAIVTFSGSLDFLEHKRLVKALEPLIGAAIAIVDLSQVQYFDSSSLSQLLHVERARQRAGREQTRVVAGPSVMRLIEVAGLAQVFRIFPTLDEATAT